MSFKWEQTKGYKGKDREIYEGVKQFREERNDLDNLNPEYDKGELAYKLEALFAQFDASVEVMFGEENANQEILNKIAQLIDTLKIHHLRRQGYDAELLSVLQTVFFAKLIQMSGDAKNFANMVYEKSDDSEETNRYFDIVRVELAGDSKIYHPTKRGGAKVPNFNIPYPILNERAFKVLSEMYDFSVVDRPEHDRTTYKGQNESYWRVAATAEALSFVKSLLKAGVDIVKMAEVILADGRAKGVRSVIEFIDQHKDQSLAAMASIRINEQYEDRLEVPSITRALQKQEYLQSSILYGTDPNVPSPSNETAGDEQ